MNKHFKKQYFKKCTKITKSGKIYQNSQKVLKIQNWIQYLKKYKKSNKIQKISNNLK